MTNCSHEPSKGNELLRSLDAQEQAQRDDARAIVLASALGAAMLVAQLPSATPENS